jgi:glutamine synthetase
VQGTEGLISRLELDEVRYVRFTWTDNAGLIRAKGVHVAVLDDYLAGARVGVTPAGQGLPVMYDAVSAGSGLTPAGEVHLVPDWSTLCVLPFTPGHARVLVDVYDGERPWAHCPRDFLRRMIARADDQGLVVKAAFENEFYLLEPTQDGWKPLDGTVFCQTSALDGAASVLNGITEALEVQGLVAEMVYAESGPGQFEMPIRYADALAAADQQVAFRETVRGVAHTHGLIASFLPKIFADRAGSGAHLHFSLWDGSSNVTGDPGQPGAISSQAASFVAGILAHLPALMALTTPSPNSYKRIRPHFWSGAFSCWGYGNREAAVRVPPAAIHGAPISNVELKTVDPTCNPYLALGAVIAAGLDGLASNMSPGEPVQVDPADLPDAERATRGIRALPTTLGEAIEAFGADRVLHDALGADLARSFLAVRQAEWQGMKELSHVDEVQLLLERY